MKEIVVIVSKKQSQVRILEENLREKGYVPFVCKTVPDLIDTIHMVPETEACIPLVVIDPAILDNIVNDDELVAQLSNCDKRIPFAVMDEAESKSESIKIFYKLCKDRTRFNPNGSTLGNAIRKSCVAITHPRESPEGKK